MKPKVMWKRAILISAVCLAAAAAPASAAIEMASQGHKDKPGQPDLLNPQLKWTARTAPCFVLHTYPQPLKDQMLEYGQRTECMSKSPKWADDRIGEESGTKEKNEVTAENATIQWIRYTVNKGDTLYSISRQFQVPLEAIIMSNMIEDPNYIRVGQTLRIPSALPSALPSAPSPTPASASVQIAGAAPFTQIGSLNVSRVLDATLTAYTAGYESTGKRPGDPAYGITYSGTKVREGRTIAVDPDVIPLGTQVYIEGLGIRTAEDIGSAIKGNRIDVYMDDVEEALKFGVQKNVKVYVLHEP